MEIFRQLTDLHTVEVSFHGPQRSYFELAAGGCCSCSESSALSSYPAPTGSGALPEHASDSTLPG